MTVNKISFAVTYCVGNMFWVKPGMEAEIEDHESPKASLDELKAMVEEWTKRRFPDAQMSIEPDVIQHRR